MTSPLALDARTLDRVPTERAHDPQSAIEVVRRHFTDHELRPGAAPLHLQFRSAMREELGLHYVDYGVPVSIRATPLPKSWLICIPLGGTANIHHSGATWHSDDTRAAVLPHDREFSFDWNEAAPQFVLSVPDDLLRRTALRLLGPEAGLTGLPELIDLDQPAGRAFLASLMAVHEDANAGAADALPPAVSRGFVESLLVRLITVSTLDAPQGVERAATGKTVRAFLDLVTSSGAVDLTPCEAADGLGLPLRTLQEATRRELGLTPHEVLARERLRRARHRLQSADPNRTTVTAIALECGFRHTGRFAAQYRREFGEPPSATLTGRH
ncbi:MAG: AraC family transcriptional regulator [Pseudoclavibacter sp.]